MPINQPVQRTIDVKDLQNGAYSFIVESVLFAEEAPGKLVVSASKSYLLTTSLTNQPQSDQTFEHIKQPDGSWLASGTVTVLAGEKSLINGTVMIQNPLGETTVLPLVATENSIERSMPLTVDHSELTFAPTSSGKPSYLILTVAQQNADEPVLVTTDEPDYFQFATDSHPKFTSSLAFMPSPIGTYVHVRYVASKRGVIRGQLFIQGTNETKTVDLTGRSVSLLPSLRHRRPAYRYSKRNRSTASVMRQSVGLLLVLAMAGGLAYAGFVNRYRLFPSLYQTEAENQVVTQEASTLKTLNRADVAPVKEPDNKPKHRRKDQKHSTKSLVQPTADKKSDKKSDAKLANDAEPATELRDDAQYSAVPRKRTHQTVDGPTSGRPRNQASTPSPSEESDLERELNQNQNPSNPNPYK